MPNPDPSPATRFQPGQSGNPGGKTAEQRKAEVEAAELAAKVQRAMLEALAEHVSDNPAAALEAIKADPLRLIKDAMDRAHGQPTQPVDLRGPDEAFTRLAGRLGGAAPLAAGEPEPA